MKETYNRYEEDQSILKMIKEEHDKQMNREKCEGDL